MSKKWKNLERSEYGADIHDKVDVETGTVSKRHLAGGKWYVPKNSPRRGENWAAEEM